MVWWSKAVCATLGQSGPMSATRAAKTLANGLAADLFLRDVLTNLHLHVKDKVDLERVVEILDLQFLDF